MINKYKFRKISFSFLTHLFLLLVAVSCIFPLLWTFASSLKTQDTVTRSMSLVVKNPQWINFRTAWTEAQFGRYFLNSVFYTVSVVAGVVLISSLAGFAFSKLKFWGRQTLFVLFIVTMLIPLDAAFVPLVVLMNKFRWIDTPWGYVFPLINTGLAMAIYLLKTFFDRTPDELEDSARIDGCSKFGVYWHIAFPLAKPAIAVVVIFNSLNVWNEFFWANLVFNSQKLMPLQRGLIMFHGSHVTRYHLLMAAIMITIVPVIMLYLFMQKYIIRGIAAGALKG